MLFDLKTDPDEFIDLAKSDGHQEEIERLYGMLAQWGRRMSQRVTKSDEDIKAMRGLSLRRGILPFSARNIALFGRWNRGGCGVVVEISRNGEGQDRDAARRRLTEAHPSKHKSIVSYLWVLCAVS